MNLIEFARLFNLTEMEKQAYILNKVRDVAILLQYNVIEWLSFYYSNVQSGHQKRRTHQKEVSILLCVRGSYLGHLNNRFIVVICQPL